MKTWTTHHPRRRARRAVTLIEALVSLAIVAVLMGAMGSAIVIASHAIDSTGAARAREQASVSDLLARIDAELSYATSITSVGTTFIEFTVPDRGHDAAGPETIRYEWTGAPGDPIVRTYNGNSFKFPQPVQSFSIVPTTGLGTIKGTPTVLILVGSSAWPTTYDIARRDLLQSWGFNVTMYGKLAPVYSEIRAAAATADVIYVSEWFSWLVSGGTDFNIPVGIVNELQSAYSTIGFGAGTVSSSSNKVAVSDNSHPISSSLPNGNIAVTADNASSERIIMDSGSPASGLRSLAQSIGSPTLLCIDLAGALKDGRPAAARRVNLPWGGYLLDPTDIAHLSGSSHTILKRSLTWAAAPVVYQSFRISLQVGTTPQQQVRVTPYNQPRVPRS